MVLDAIGIVAENVQSSVHFYSLFDLSFSSQEGSENHVEARTTSGLRIMIDSESLMKELNPNWVKPEGQRMTLAFLCKTPAEVDSLYQKIIKEGYRGTKEPWNAFWGQRYATVQDPDGNAVDIFSPL